MIFCLEWDFEIRGSRLEGRFGVGDDFWARLLVMGEVTARDYYGGTLRPYVCSLPQLWSGLDLRDMVR